MLKGLQGFYLNEHDRLYLLEAFAMLSAAYPDLETLILPYDHANVSIFNIDGFPAICAIKTNRLGEKLIGKFNKNYINTWFTKLGWY